MSDLLSIFEIFDVLWTCFWGGVLGPCGKMEYRKRAKKGVPFGTHVGPFASMVAVGFLLFFWMRHVLTFCSFRFNSGSNFGAFFGYLGTLEIGLKR